MAISAKMQIALFLSGAVFLAACDGASLPSFMQGNDDDEMPIAQSGATRLVERDVEAPEVFQKTETGLWDGRPSLGGVWVAHPDVTDPERVIIRNEVNGKFVIGALFRREREVPGPRFQVSSDAAGALGLLAGQPAQLNITALRREEVADESAEATVLPAAATVAATSLDPIEAAAAALDEAEGIAPAIAAPASASASGLTKPFIQIGIFSVETNANNTAEAMRRAGMIPTIKPGTSSGQSFWRVIVGPAQSSTERAALLRKIKGLGFGDSYFVTN